MNQFESNPFDLKSGSIETLINLSDEGPWMTLLPYLHGNNLTESKKKNLRFFSRTSSSKRGKFNSFQKPIEAPNYKRFEIYCKQYYKRGDKV